MTESRKTIKQGVSLKLCSGCKEQLSLDNFNKSQNYCRFCQQVHRKKYYLENTSREAQTSKLYKSKHPWHNTYTCIISRCTNTNNESYPRYGGKGIKCLITVHELKELWIRDNACDMERPSIDRIDPDKDYNKENCRYIELTENIRRKFETSNGRLKHDENFILKVLSEVGDVARLLRGIIARQDKLERRVDLICKSLEK